MKKVFTVIAICMVLAVASAVFKSCRPIDFRIADITISARFGSNSELPRFLIQLHQNGLIVKIEGKKRVIA